MDSQLLITAVVAGMLAGALASTTIVGFSAWIAFTFRQRIVTTVWKGGLEDLMWLSFAEAAENQAENADGVEDLGMAGNLGALIGDGNEDGLLANAGPILQMLEQADFGDETSELGGSGGMNDIQGWD